MQNDSVSQMSSSCSTPELLLLITTNPNPHHHGKRNVPHDSPLAMRDLTLTRIAAHRINLRRQSHRPRLFCVDPAAPKSPMADESSSTLKVEKKEEEAPAEEEKKLPPPPEKPLPGDCCGSGCVRCVWDVYYEELEDYNKLISEIKSKSDSDSKQA